MAAAKPDYWNDYLDKTLFAPGPAILTFLPAALLLWFGIAVLDVGVIPAIFFGASALTRSACRVAANSAFA